MDKNKIAAFERGPQTQQQSIKKICNSCSKVSEAPNITNETPKYCIYCGNNLDYFSPK